MARTAKSKRRTPAKPNSEGKSRKRVNLRPTTGLTPKKLATFCETLSRGYSVAAACRAIKVSRQWAYDERKRDPEFAAAWDDAIENGADALEDRLTDIGNSSLPGNVTSIIFQLKGRRPEKYRERTDLTNSDGSIVNAFAEAMAQHGSNTKRGDRDEADSA